MMGRLAARLGLAGALLFAQLGGADAGCAVAPAAIVHSPGYVPGRAETVVLDPAAYPHALCNDGTPGAYAIRPGFGAAAKRWVIWLHGGGMCFSQGSCAARFGTSQTSSRAYATGRPVGLGGGIQSQDPAQNPDFYDATLVAVAYCSSDFWSGGSDGDPAFSATDVRSWHFRGRDIATAVIRDLIARRGLGAGQQAGQEVLFGGGSAGGVGVFLRLNDVAPLLGSRRLLAVSDGGFGIDAQGPNGRDAQALGPDGQGSGGATPMEAFVARAMALWRGRGDGPCTEAARTERDRMNCTSPDFLTHGGRLATPVFIRQSEQDRMLLRLNGVRFRAPDAHATLQSFGAGMARALATVDPWHSVFATLDTGHVMMETAAFTLGRATFPSPSGIIETRIATAFGQWYQRPCPATRDIQPP